MFKGKSLEEIEFSDSVESDSDTEQYNSRNVKKKKDAVGEQIENTLITSTFSDVVDFTETKREAICENSVSHSKLVRSKCSGDSGSINKAKTKVVENKFKDNDTSSSSSDSESVNNTGSTASVLLH